jgi:hypothetical protein
MLDFLAGVPGRLKTIADYLTTHLSSTRAAKIDNLDAAISTRAPASTALTNATWTPTRAGHLDLISSRAAESSPLLSAPMLNGVVTAVTASTLGGAFDIVGITQSSSTTSTTYSTALTVTGQGVLNFASVASSGSTHAASIKITIDGVAVFEGGTGTRQSLCPVGAYIPGTAVALDQVPFKTSLLIEHKIANSASNSVAFYKYRKTT